MLGTTIVTGGSGMLGTELKNHLPDASFWEGRKFIDLSYPEIQDVLYLIKPVDTIIHCAAYTDLNFCDRYPIQSNYLHNESVQWLQNKCKKLIYISTNPTNSKRVYYKTKQQGELTTLKRKGDLVIRTNIYGDGGLAKWAINNLKSQQKINGYSNVIFNPVSVKQLSSFLKFESYKFSGIVNIGSSSIVSKYDFIKILALKYNFDLDLISPFVIKGDTNLTVPLEKQRFVCNLMDGIDTLNMNYE
jgi:dTDP-4-dehydrorhamnose reductase